MVGRVYIHFFAVFQVHPTWLAIVVMIPPLPGMALINCLAVKVALATVLPR